MVDLNFVFIGLPFVDSYFCSWNESSFGDRTINSRGSMFRVWQNRGCRIPQNFRALATLSCQYAIADDRLVAFHCLSRKHCAPADIELMTTKEAPETAGLAQSVQSVEPRSVELCNV